MYGRHASPGQRYSVIEDTCGGQYIAGYDVAHGTADRYGDLTIVAPDQPLGIRCLDLLDRRDDGAPLGGVQGLLTGNGARTFWSAPPC